MRAAFSLVPPWTTNLREAWPLAPPALIRATAMTLLLAAIITLALVNYALRGHGFGGEGY